MSASLYPIPKSVDATDFMFSTSSEAQLVDEGNFIAEAQGTWSVSSRKRFFDVAVAGTVIVPMLPILAAIAVVVKCSSNGPVLFRQQRTGRGQVPFTIYKYRTMRLLAEQEGPSVTRKGDGRMTRVGLWLRRLKLDELPQLYNVIRGDMSLVGPRPKAIGHERMEMVCRPGITGVATLLFAREEDLLMEVPEEEVEGFAINVLNPIKAQLDAQYAEEGNFFTDIALLAKTALRLGRKKAVRTLPELTTVYGYPVVPRNQSN